MPTTLETTNNCDNVDNVIINYFGRSPDKIISIIEKQKQMAELANASTKKYYDKMKYNDEFVAKALERKVKENIIRK